MGYSFDGPNKRINLTTGTVTLGVRDLWSRWVDWMLTSDNSKYLPAFEQVGGNDIDTGAGTKIPVYAYLQNGWRIKPQEANHTLGVGDGILLVDGGGDPFVDTTGSFIVRINYQQPVQAISFNSGAVVAPTQQQIRDAMTLSTSETPATGSIDDKIDSVSVVAVGSAINVRADSFTLTTGTQTGTYLDTYDLNGVYHQIDPVGNAIDGYYEFDIGADYAPVSASIVGRMAGTTNTAEVWAWHWVDAQWRQIGSLAGKNSDVTESWNLFIAHVGTGANAGKVRIRFSDTGATNNLYIDQLWVSYAPLGAFNSTDRVKVEDVHKRLGLDAAAPLTQTTSSITAGGVSLAITGDPDVSVTVTRQP